MYVYAYVCKLELERAMCLDSTHEPYMGERVARLMSQPTLVFEHPYMYIYNHAWAYLYKAFALFEDVEEAK